MRKYLLFLLLSLITICIKSQQLPEFKLISLNGDTITNDFLKNKLIYINVFETYCGPCITELPVLNSLMHKHSDVVFIAISPASREKVIQFKEKHPIDFLVIPDAKKLCNAIYANSYPSHVIVDKSGIYHDYTYGVGIIVDTSSKEKQDKSYCEFVYNKIDKLLTEFKNK